MALLQHLLYQVQAVQEAEAEDQQAEAETGQEEQRDRRPLATNVIVP